MKDSRGLVPRSIEYIFEQLRDNSFEGKQSFAAKCSFFEIYQEKVYDLLADVNAGNLEVRENPKNGVFVDGITEEQVRSVEEASNILSLGRNNRHGKYIHLFSFFILFIESSNILVQSGRRT
jgi:hypothetical protein